MGHAHQVQVKGKNNLYLHCYLTIVGGIDHEIWFKDENWKRKRVKNKFQVDQWSKCTI